MKGVCGVTAIIGLGFLVLVSGVRGDGRSLQQSPPEFCVAINEVVNKPADIGDQKGVDYLELKNDCDEAIDMAGWVISDEEGKEFQLGGEGCEGTHRIEGKGYFVFFRDAQCSFTFGYKKNDMATLKDSTGLQMDQTEWSEGDADEGFSWSRIPDGSGPFKTSLPTPGVENVEA